MLRVYTELQTSRFFRVQVELGLGVGFRVLEFLRRFSAFKLRA